MKNIFSFCNQKGGVGKTTSAINIATYAALQGYKTLLVDMDAQANTTSGLGIEKPAIESTAYQLFVDNAEARPLVIETGIENLSLIPSSAHLAGAELDLVSKLGRELVLKSQLSGLANEYEFVMIDCPPSIGLLTVNCLCASNYIIIPLQCEYYAMEGLGQLLNVYQLIQKSLNSDLEIGGVLLTMADFRTNLTQQVIEEIRGYFKEKVFEAVVPRSVKLSEAPSFGKPAILYDASNKGSKAYREAGKEFLGRFAAPKVKIEKPTEVSRPQDGDQKPAESQEPAASQETTNA